MKAHMSISYFSRLIATLLLPLILMYGCSPRDDTSKIDLYYSCVDELANYDMMSLSITSSTSVNGSISNESLYDIMIYGDDWILIQYLDNSAENLFHESIIKYMFMDDNYYIWEENDGTYAWHLTQETLYRPSLWVPIIENNDVPVNLVSVKEEGKSEIITVNLTPPQDSSNSPITVSISLEDNQIIKITSINTFSSQDESNNFTVTNTITTLFHCVNDTSILEVFNSEKNNIGS